MAVSVGFFLEWFDMSVCDDFGVGQRVTCLKACGGLSVWPGQCIPPGRSTFVP